MLKVELIEYLQKNGGTKDINHSWEDVAKLFSLEINNKESKNAKQINDYIRGYCRSVYNTYLKQVDKLELVKQTYLKGKKHSETFRKTPIEAEGINEEDFEVKRFTKYTNGGAWVKYEKKETLFNEDHLEKLARMLNMTTVINQAPSPPFNNKILCVYLADEHIGALTKEQSIYTNKYTKEEIEDRIVRRLVEVITAIYATNPSIKNLCVFSLGDCLDGFNQKTTRGNIGGSSHTLPQQYNNREQHDIFVEVHKKLFDTLFSYKIFTNISYIANCNSNHGGDYEYAAVRTLQMYLNLKYPQIKTYVTCKPIDHIIVGNQCIIFGHGKDDADMIKGFPLNLDPKVENFINDYIRINNLHSYNISVITADLHQASENYGKNFRYRKVLSQYGSSAWAHSNFGSGAPGISLDVFLDELNLIQKFDYFFQGTDMSNTGIKL